MPPTTKGLLFMSTLPPDGAAVNGSAQGVGKLAGVMRYLQTGLINHYAIAMIIGLIGLVYWFALR